MNIWRRKKYFFYGEEEKPGRKRSEIFEEGKYICCRGEEKWRGKRREENDWICYFAEEMKDIEVIEGKCLEKENMFFYGGASGTLAWGTLDIWARVVK